MPLLSVKHIIEQLRSPLPALGSVNVGEKRMNKDKLPIMGVPRRVRVKGMEGVDVTVVVTVVQGKVWLSISPPFTWEAIMEPGKVDEVMSVLRLARDEAKKVATARNGNALPGDETITDNGSAIHAPSPRR